MSGLESISVRVEGAFDTPVRTDNLRPLLVQLEEALYVLVENGTESTIDLGAMPFSEQDEEDLRQLLGRGEVAATIDVFGPTLVQETRYPGIWLVEHQDAERRRLTLHLQIARIPEILVTPGDDLADGLSALRELNLGFPDTPTEDVQ